MKEQKYPKYGDKQAVGGERQIGSKRPPMKKSAPKGKGKC
jgi:hypothetical protein